MKKNNPMYKQFLDQYEHQWFECLAVFASSIDSLKDKKEDEIEYDKIKKIFSLLEEEKRIMDDIRFLKKKYSNLYKRYKKEKSEESEELEKLWNKFSKDKDKPAEEVYDLVVEAMYNYYDTTNVEKKSAELSWIEELKEETTQQSEWIDKHLLESEDINFSVFHKDGTMSYEEKIRKNITNSITKYVDLVFDFDQFYTFGLEKDSQSVQAEEKIYEDSIKTETKYEMLRYFNQLCNFRDLQNKSKSLPHA